MKKLVLLFAAVAFVGCSNDDDNTPSPTPTNTTSFKYDGTVFNLQPGLNMNDMVMAGVTDFNGESYDRSTLSITGLNGTASSATIAFDLYYKTGTSVAGTYNIYDSEASGAADNFEDFLVGQNRGCMGWISQGAIFNMSTSTMMTGNNPTGTVEVIVNSPTNYTVKYNSNFRLYENGFDFVRNMPAEINVTQNVTITQN